MNIENNKIIAEFMGWEVIKDQSNFWVDCNPNIEETPLQLLNEVFKDWNWLMEVINKLTTLNEFQDYEFKSLFWDTFCQLDIKEVYIQVVLFIKWYNLQNS